MQVELNVNKFIWMPRFYTVIQKFFFRKILEVRCYDCITAATDCSGDNVFVTRVGQVNRVD